MSVISDAIVASMASGLDPMNGVTRDYADKVIEKTELEIVGLANGLLNTLMSSRAAAVEANASVSVLDAFDRLLARASK